MKKITHLLFIAFTVAALASCSRQPEPIKYGEDSCHYCSMTIVSEAFSAQAVSSKGKQHKYDAIECMVNDLLENNSEPAIQRVADFSRPGTMIDAEMAKYVINDSINSPMGANLAALQQETYPVDGKENVFSWEELKTRFLGANPVTTNH